jgi:hypothetical protein
VQFPRIVCARAFIGCAKPRALRDWNESNDTANFWATWLRRGWGKDHKVCCLLVGRHSYSLRSCVCSRPSASFVAWFETVYIFTPTATHSFGTTTATTRSHVLLPAAANNTVFTTITSLDFGAKQPTNEALSNHLTRHSRLVSSRTPAVSQRYTTTYQRYQLPLRRCDTLSYLTATFRINIVIAVNKQSRIPYLVIEHSL